MHKQFQTHLLILRTPSPLQNPPFSSPAGSCLSSCVCNSPPRCSASPAAVHRRCHPSRFRLASWQTAPHLGFLPTGSPHHVTSPVLSLPQNSVLPTKPLALRSGAWHLQLSSSSYWELHPPPTPTPTRIHSPFCSGSQSSGVSPTPPHWDLMLRRQRSQRLPGSHALPSHPSLHPAAPQPRGHPRAQLSLWQGSQCHPAPQSSMAPSIQRGHLPGSSQPRGFRRELMGKRRVLKKRRRPPKML